MMRKGGITILLLLLAACYPIVELEEASLSPTSTLFSTLESAVTIEIIGTAVPVEQPAPPPPGSAPVPAYPPPPIQPTSPYPGSPPSTLPTRIRPTATPVITIQPIDDCTLHPSFSRCDGAPLTGELAYFQPNGQLTVLNLDTETAWVSNQANLTDVDWSPTGDRLLVHDEIFRETTFYYKDGRLLHSETNGWVKWGNSGNDIRAGSYLWNEDYSTAASIIFVEVKNDQDSSTHAERQLQVEYRDGTGRKVWSLEAPDYQYDAVALLDWVPQTEWLLVGYGGAATRITSGYRLMAVNAYTGEIVDSGLFTPGLDQLDWHPSQTGLLVTTDLGQTDVGGLGVLVTWQVLENRVEYPLETSQLARSSVWSPDGRYIAYSAYDLSGDIRLKVLDTETSVVTKRAERGDFPAWSRDGATIFYLEMGAEMGAHKKPAFIRAVGREQGEPTTVAISRFPRCPGTCLPRTAFDYTPDFTEERYGRLPDNTPRPPTHLRQNRGWRPGR